MEISISENVRPGANYSTVFQANRDTFGINKPRDSRFSFGLVARTELVMTGFYDRAGNQMRVEWSVASSRGESNPIVDTPEVYEALNEIAKRVEAANEKLTLAPVTTWLLTPDVELPQGVGDLAKKGLDTLTNPFEKVGEGLAKMFKTGGVALIAVVGVVAVGLAVGLSKSRANL